MLGDVIELSVVVRDLEAAIDRFTRLFGLKVDRRSDPAKAVGRFLDKHGEGVYLVGFEVKDISGAVDHLRGQGAQVDYRRPAAGQEQEIAWIHPRETHGVFVELRQREAYGRSADRESVAERP